MDYNLFPHDSVRAVQKEFMEQVQDAVAKGKCLLAHAPTGIGKTAATLTPALKVALEKGLTVFFLTSRHTQHSIAIETLRKMQEKSGKSFSVADIIGKKWMCCQSGVEALYSKQFHDYCRAMKEDEQCEFYLNLKKANKLTSEAKKALSIVTMKPVGTERIVEESKALKVCPYEIAMLAAQKASVIIADYYYLFSPGIREAFLKKTGKKLEKSIIIIDEGHNLPGRMRELLSERTSTVVVGRAIKEAQKYGKEEEQEFLVRFGDILAELAEDVPERIVAKEELKKKISEKKYEEISSKLHFSADEVREQQRQSFIGSVASFLDVWDKEEKGYARIIRQYPGKYGNAVSLSYACLDPAIATAEVIKKAHSAIIMSGTLNPTEMYKDLLGFPAETKETVFSNPFPKSNRLALIIPSVTTKFSKRNEQQYSRIADISAEISNLVPGNVVIYFPSYKVRDEVHKFLHGCCNKKIMKESPEMSKKEKTELLEKFKEGHKEGSILLAVFGGNFSEGIDLPGDFLKAVIVVGLPLGQPDLETKMLIKYYDEKYGKGWDYGYVLPAFVKALQSAGRCIRSETDRGLICFLDERYAWERYYKCFPKDWQPAITALYKDRINEFFTTNK
ncbi:ATP-dependent DNA helicase [Candidatus Woesearchaeota archaeon]|nr:ATP-dependent DNA helicase [Candidatus Woesearchaeota archaeon]